MQQTALTEVGGRRGRTDMPRYFPLAIDMAALRCLVVGGGRIGTRKALRLADAGAEVSVLAPEISAHLQKHVQQGHVRWQRGAYDASALEGIVFVVAATDDDELNLRIGRDADARGILCCIVSSGSVSRVIFPAVYRDETITVAVHSDGQDCRLSQRVRDLIASEWETRGGPFASTEPPTRKTRPRSAGSRRRLPAGARLGKVYIIGAGPGAPDLISVRGYRALRSADVILVDELLPRTFLDELGISTADKTVAWLGENEPHWPQARINRWLVSHARAGKTVVRLKGGDPFVFGRGDVEIDYLWQQRIPWEVIPGCSSATAVLTAAGLPLTRRGSGRSFTVATARVAGGGLAPSFPRSDSLVILMGVGVLRQVVARLLADGWPPDTPAAVIERGTLPWERRVTGPLGQLDRLASEAGVASPALIVVGVAANAVAAFQRRPTILFTGRDPKRFAALGNLLHWPALSHAAQGEAHRAHPELGRPLPEHDVIYFVSPAAVGTYWETYGPAAFGRSVWCLGERTRKTLARYGVRARVVKPCALPTASIGPIDPARQPARTT